MGEGEGEGEGEREGERGEDENFFAMIIYEMY